jgi:hypothetical protein
MALLRKRLLLGFGVLLLLVAGDFVYSFMRMWLAIPESYAAWTSGNALEDYMLENTNHWPRNWDELGSATNRLNWFVPVERLLRLAQ